MLNSRNKRGTFKYLSLGLEITVGLSLPVFIGYRLDLRWGTSPWLLLLGALAGFVILAGIMIRIARDSNGHGR